MLKIKDKMSEESKDFKSQKSPKLLSSSTAPNSISVLGKVIFSIYLSFHNKKKNGFLLYCYVAGDNDKPYF